MCTNKKILVDNIVSLKVLSFCSHYEILYQEKIMISNVTAIHL